MTKIGLEIHGYLNTKEKLFCGCKSLHGIKHAKPNTNICPICTAQPGSKPSLPNKSAIEKAIQIALIFGCKINTKLTWQRKHYDWPDLPKGFQNTLSGTYAVPVGENGKFFGKNITECHLEEDPAAWNPSTGEIDYNKSGSPLIEIVTAPDFKNSEEVHEWLNHLIITLDYIKAIDKKSGIKADVNVSINGGKRIEIKNLNSLTNIKASIEYEIERQKNPSEIPKEQETRMFDENKGITIKMRSKEETQDYRFISEPDLPVINITKQKIKIIKSHLPETPQEKLKKLIKKYEISKKDAEIITKKLEIVEFFEKIVAKISSSMAIPWIMIELLSVLNYNKKNLDDPDIDIKAEHFIELLDMVKDKKITELKAKEILRKFIPKSFPVAERLGEHAKIVSESVIEKICGKVIEENKKAVEDYKKGKKESLNFLIGQVMRLSNKRADYRSVKEMLEKALRD